MSARLLDIAVSDLDVAGVAARLAALATAEEAAPLHHFATVNQYSLLMASRDEAFRQALRRADTVSPDGIGALVAARALGARLPTRVPGPDVMRATLAALEGTAAPAAPVFFLGSTDEVLARLVRAVEAQYPGVPVAGAYSPPFRATFTAADDVDMLARIEESGARVVFVGLGAPKQELWVERNRPRLSARVALSVGAAFEFVAGTVARAPQWMQRAGLEWLHRLGSDPRRLWRRYLVGGPQFAALVARERARAAERRRGGSGGEAP